MAEQDIEEVDEMTALESAIEVLGMASLKYIEVHEDVNSEPGPVEFKVEPTGRAKRLTWSTEEREALRELFEEGIGSFGGRKPPISKV